MKRELIKTEILIATRAFEPAKGSLDLPGGFVDPDETAEECIIREIEEETGLIIKHPKYLFSLPNRYVYSDFEVHTLDMFFESIIKDDVNIIAKDDVAHLQFIHPQNIDTSLFGLISIRIGIIKYIKTKEDF